MDEGDELVSVLMINVGLDSRDATGVIKMIDEAKSLAVERRQYIAAYVVTNYRGEWTLCALPKYNEGMEETLKDMLDNMRNERNGPLRAETLERVGVKVDPIGDLTEDWLTHTELALLVGVFSITTNWVASDSNNLICEMIAASLLWAIPRAAHAWRIDEQPPGILILNMSDKFRVHWLEQNIIPTTMSDVGYA